MREKPKAPETLISAEAQAFAEAARRGVLVLRECLDCGDVHHYPRAHCPLCASRNLGWREASGQGRVYSFTRMAGRRAVAPAMMATPMSVAIRPYSTAVAPDSSFTKRETMDFIVVTPQVGFKLHWLFVDAPTT